MQEDDFRMKPAMFDDVPVIPIKGPNGPAIDGRTTAVDDHALVIRCRVEAHARVRLHAVTGGAMYMSIGNGPFQLLCRNTNPRVGRKNRQYHEISAKAGVAVDLEKSPETVTFVFWPESFSHESHLQLIYIDELTSAIAEASSRDEIVLVPRLSAAVRVKWSADNEVMFGGTVRVKLFLNGKRIEMHEVGDAIHASIPANGSANARLDIHPAYEIRVVGENSGTDSKQINARFDPKPVD